MKSQNCSQHERPKGMPGLGFAESGIFILSWGESKSRMIATDDLREHPYTWFGYRHCRGQASLGIE
jgi:hypothetical protein